MSANQFFCGQNLEQQELDKLTHRSQVFFYGNMKFFFFYYQSYDIKNRLQSYRECDTYFFY